MASTPRKSKHPTWGRVLRNSIGAGMAVIAVGALAGCAADPKPGLDIAGSWTGVYRWDRGDAYPVTLAIPESSLAGKVTVRFSGTESAGRCPLVQVEGTLHVPSRKVVLDEVDTECENFVLDGIYEGRLSTDGQAMDLVWVLDASGGSDDGSSGTLNLTKISGEVPPDDSPTTAT